MSQVLNIQDRTQAFLKFVLFFCITILVLMIAIFFDFNMPTVENRALKEEVYSQRQRDASQERFSNKMEMAVTLLDSIEKNPALAPQLRPQFEVQITELNALQENGASSYAKMNSVIIAKLIKVNELFKNAAEINARMGRIPELERQLQECKGDLKDASQSQTQIVN